MADHEMLYPNPYPGDPIYEEEESVEEPALRPASAKPAGNLSDPSLPWELISTFKVAGHDNGIRWITYFRLTSDMGWTRILNVVPPKWFQIVVESVDLEPIMENSVLNVFAMTGIELRCSRNPASGVNKTPRIAGLVGGVTLPRNILLEREQPLIIDARFIHPGAQDSGSYVLKADVFISRVSDK